MISRSDDVTAAIARRGKFLPGWICRLAFRVPRPRRNQAGKPEVCGFIDLALLLRPTFLLETSSTEGTMQINGHSHAHASAGHSPAKQAREAIATRPDLEEMTFGALVSRLARGQELPPAASTAATEGAG